MIAPSRVGYFGGSFDPPHRGHLAVACAARDRFGLGRVLLAPTGRQPFKPAGPEASFADRLRMTELLCLHEPALEASALDAPRATGEPNYTVDTLERLHATLPATADLYAIVGADAFLGVPQWRAPERLFSLAQWIVVSRPGVVRGPWEQLRLPAAARVHWLADLQDPTSATGLRDRLKAGTLTGEEAEIGGALPARVADYIRAHHLYGQ